MSDPPKVSGTLSLCVPPAGVSRATIELPEWYESYAGNVSIWTPYGTCVVHNKPPTNEMPFMAGWPATHYAEVGEHDGIEPGEYRHPELAPDLLAIKPFTEPRKYYRVDTSNTRTTERD